MGEPVASEATYSCADGILKQEDLKIMVAAWIFLHLLCLLASHWSCKGDHYLRMCAPLKHIGFLAHWKSGCFFQKPWGCINLWNKSIELVSFSSVKKIQGVNQRWAFCIIDKAELCLIGPFWGNWFWLGVSSTAAFQRTRKLLCSGQHMKWASVGGSFIPTPLLGIGWLSWVWSFNRAHTTGRGLFWHELHPTKTRCEFCFRNYIAFSD